MNQESTMSDSQFIIDLQLRINNETKNTELGDKLRTVYARLAADQEVSAAAVNNLTLNIQDALQADVENTPHVVRCRKILHGLLEGQRMS